uniref:Secreted protein n=1 Tax=Steinernema glaseri TaxID=37863 RepID=A0A1I8AWF2_9BILA
MGLSVGQRPSGTLSLLMAALLVMVVEVTTTVNKIGTRKSMDGKTKSSTFLSFFHSFFSRVRFLVSITQPPSTAASSTRLDAVSDETTNVERLRNLTLAATPSTNSSLRDRP